MCNSCFTREQQTDIHLFGEVCETCHGEINGRLYKDTQNNSICAECWTTRNKIMVCSGGPASDPKNFLYGLLSFRECIQ